MNTGPPTPSAPSWKLRKHREKFPALHPADGPHRTCKDCPMLRHCPLTFYVTPCVFKCFALDHQP